MIRFVHLRRLAATLAIAAACTDDPTSLPTPRLRADDAPLGAGAPPDTVPAWAYADANVAALAPGRAAGAATLRDVVLVLFHEGVSADRRDSALARVGGRVVGGRRVFGDDGVWLVQVAVDEGDPAAGVLRAADSLAALPEVAAAAPELMGPDGADWLVPRDDAAAGRWTVSPDSATTDANWAFERVGAPLAWGCATGDTHTAVAVVDRGFAAAADLAPNLSPNATDAPPLPAEPAGAGGGHGVAVTSILAARGDNGIGMAGMMWYADVRAFSRAAALPAGRADAARATALLADASALAAAVASGARVINVSGALAPAPAAGDVAAIARQEAFNARAVGFLVALLRRAETRAGTQPLYVFSAGNVHGAADASDAATRDAAWNTFPALRDSLPSRVLVVAASDTRDALLATSKAGALVEIAAPGESVLALDAAGAIRPAHATSAAAPLVAGAAGLLFSFDPSLTAAQVKRLLVDGARAGGRSTNASGAHDYPIVNAYEALRLASTRPGAPLCGRRLWYDGESIVIDRDSSLAEAERIPLALGGSPVRHIVSADGGREIWFRHHVDSTGQSAVGRATLGTDGRWVVALDATAAWEASDTTVLGGRRVPASRVHAAGGASRAGDSTVWVEATYAPGYADDSGEPITFRQPWHASLRGAAWVTRLSVWVGAPSDVVIGSGAHLTDLPPPPAPTFDTPRDGVLSMTAVFDGPGDHVYLAVSSTQDSAGTRVYRQPIAAGPREPALLGVVAAWRDVSHLAASEDGRQLGATYVAADGSCAVEYRDARQLDQVRRAVPLPQAACAAPHAAPSFSATKGRRR